jgi:predicted SAM-dependent methyltransferase
MFSFDRLPKSKRHIRKVQLGAGSSNAPEYINVDFCAEKGVDLVHDLRKPLPFPDNSIEEFYSHHVLEHFGYHELVALLGEVWRCLKPNGKLVSRLPDFEHAARQFFALPPGAKRDNMLICIFGGNAFGWEPRESHIHCYGWTTKTLRERLVNSGFSVEQCESVDSDSHIPVIDFTAFKGKRMSGRSKMWGERTVEVPWFLSKLKAGNVLDIGSAESCYVNEVLELGATKLTLNDVRDFNTHQDNSKVNCVIGDIRTKDPAELGKYDNVLCISTLEHIALTAYDQGREVPEDWSAFYPQKDAFRHMMKFVKRGGQMIVTIPYGKYEDSGWVIVYDKGMIDELKEGFKIVEETYFTLTDRENDTWRKVKEAQCPAKGMDSWGGQMRANSVVCLVLKNKG